MSSALMASVQNPVKVAVPTNVLIVGVGGQGVIMVSKVLAQICQQAGFQVKQSEVHGMAKRGGTVFSHVRFGHQVWSPTIPQGQADILVALEWAEGIRWLPYLKPQQGTFIADTQHIVPPFACRSRKHGAEAMYAGETVAEIARQVPNSFALDATGMAEELGNERVANTILLGTLSTALDFPPEIWQAVLEQSVPPRTREVNQQAFLRGRQWVENPPAESIPPPPPPEIAHVPVDIRLEITEVWCKGCDICVKMCPERCLTLNQNKIVELSDPEACTGCRICEWLCPDFAIAVHKEPHLEERS